MSCMIVVLRTVDPRVPTTSGRSRGGCRGFIVGLGREGGREVGREGGKGVERVDSFHA